MRKFIAASLLVILTVLFTSCKVAGKAAPKVEDLKKTIENIVIDKSSPEALLKQFYLYETRMNGDTLKQFFYKPELQNTDYIKEKIKCFNVRDIELDKIFKDDKSDNFAVITCSYKTYFRNINITRPDVETIAFICKSGKWYILNDTDGIGSDKIDWINNIQSSQKEYILSNNDIKKLYVEQANFDDSNKDFMESSNEKFHDAIKTN